jgi:TfoX/Sxy family transcriptional regulator of competence genes
MAGDRFEDGRLDRLSALGDVTSRPMFGGHGL